MGERGRRSAVWGWASYDFANSIWPMNIITLYFALWVTQDHGAPDLLYSAFLSGSMLLVALVSPPLGAVSDRYGRRLPFLIAFTLTCVVATALIGWLGGILGALLLFALANFSFQGAMVYYDALLGTVTREGDRGRVSGLGVALGYMGALAGIGLVKPFVDLGGRSAAFLPTALFFLLFSLPCFLLVREVGPARWRWSYVGEGYARVWETARRARLYGPLLRFILGRFLYVDAISTVTAFMAVYTVRVLGFTDQMNQALFLMGTAFAALGPLLYGRLADRIGPKRTLLIVLGQWALVLAVAASTFYQPVFWVLGALAGLGLGGLWTTDRVFLLRLSPPEKVGEFFGLYGLVGKLSAVLGPLLWGFLTFIFAGLGLLSYRIALVALLLLLMAGLAVLLGVREPPRLAPAAGS